MAEHVPTIAQLGGTTTLVARYANESDPHWSLFNPSIAFSPRLGYAMMFRSSNYVILDHGELHVSQGGTIKNRTYFAELDADMRPVNLREVSYANCGIMIQRGVEDPKLLWRDDRWMFTGVMLETHTPVARHCECVLDDSATAVTEIKIFPGVDARRPEKNWMTCGNRPTRFDYIYDGNGVVVNGQLIKPLQDVSQTANLRGNTHLLEEDGEYLAVMHRLKIKKSTVYIPTRFGYVDSEDKDYNHYFVKINKCGEITAVSRPFKLRGPGIEFAAGLVRHGDDYLVSFGRRDIAAYLAKIPVETVQAGLQPIK